MGRVEILLIPSAQFYLFGSSEMNVRNARHPEAGISNLLVRYDVSNICLVLLAEDQKILFLR